MAIYYGHENSYDAQRGFAVVGTQTAMSDVASNSTATYSGYARMQAADAEGYGGWRSELQVQGDVGLNLDFEKSTIAGNITNIEARNWDDVNDAGDQIWPTQIPGAFNLEEAKINSLGLFNGTMSADATLEEAIGADPSRKGSYSGALFGPNAEQVAGSLSITRDTQNAYGYFRTSKAE